MVNVKDTRPRDIIHTCMLLTGVGESVRVAQRAAEIICEMRVHPIPDQILAVATVLIMLEKKYGIKHIEAINAAENLIDAAEDAGESNVFDVLHRYMLNEWDVNEQREEKETNG